jgi:hypothetical protein
MPRTALGGRSTSMKRGRPFQPGNTVGRGRPRGSRNQARQSAQAVIEGQAAAIAEKAVLRALAGKGDSQMLRTLLLLLRESKQSPVKLGPLPTRTPEDLDQTTQRLLELTCEGRLSPTDATQMLRLIEARQRVIETRELADRVAALEQCIPGITRKKTA